jgi:hypothetical protein
MTPAQSVLPLNPGKAPGQLAGLIPGEAKHLLSSPGFV